MAGSPWGTIQYRKIFTRGFSSVSTAGHGGFMLSKRFAEKYLSREALKRAIKYRDYYCYEEDCDWAIPAFELKQYWEKIFQYAGEDINPEQYLLKTLSYWNADYLVERGIEPDSEAYAKYQERKEEEEMRRNNHPDLIVTAFSTDNPDIVRVITADGKEHFITTNSYHKKEGGLELRLSKCIKVA